MILYGLALVPLAKTLRAAFPNVPIQRLVVQYYDADDTGAMHGRASEIAGTMQLLL